MSESIPLPEIRQMALRMNFRLRYYLEIPVARTLAEVNNRDHLDPLLRIPLV